MTEILKVKTLEDLWLLERKRKAVYCPKAFNFRHPKPAAFIMNLPGFLIFQLIIQGLYVYSSKEKKQK